MKRFTEFLVDQRELEQSELDKYLARYFLVVKKKDGSEYEPETLKSFQSSLNRYLMDKINVNIIEDPAFKHSRDVLSSKKKQLKQMGLGNRPNRAEPFTKEEVNILYEKNYLGTG